MSMYVFLGVTDLDNPQEAIDDYYQHSGEKQKILMGMGSTVPPFLWPALFHNVERQKVAIRYDEEQIKEYEEDEYDYPKTFEMPFLDKIQAIENLKKVEPNISKYFSDHGGVKAIVEDFIDLIKTDLSKYIYIDPSCADYFFDSDHDVYGLGPINRIIEICNGNMGVDKEQIEYAHQFEFVDNNSKPIHFKSRSDIPDIHLDSDIDDSVAQSNYFALVGCYESSW